MEFGVVLVEKMEEDYNDAQGLSTRNIVKGVGGKYMSTCDLVDSILKGPSVTLWCPCDILRDHDRTAL
jgi:hypothetical protein